MLLTKSCLEKCATFTDFLISSGSNSSFSVNNLTSHSIRFTRSYKEPNPSAKVTSFNLLIREELLINKSDFIKNEASENLAFNTFS